MEPSKDLTLRQAPESVRRRRGGSSVSARYSGQQISYYYHSVSNIIGNITAYIMPETVNMMRLHLEMLWY